MVCVTYIYRFARRTNERFSGNNVINRENVSKPTLKKRKSSSRAIPGEFADKPHLKKFWAQRYKLFSKYDEGILLDEGN